MARPLEIVSVAFGSVLTDRNHTWLYVVDRAGRLWCSMDAGSWGLVDGPTTDDDRKESKGDGNG